MPTITTVDATWGTSVTMDDGELRRADTAMFLGDGTSNGVRGGIVRHGDNSLAVTVNGSDQVTVQPGAFVIPAATGLGVYRGSLAAATAATAITARNATNPRIDLVVVQAPGIVKTIDGTPGASPVAPALPAQHIELARITVPAVGGGAVTVDSTWRAYATGLGGTLYAETSARLPGSGNMVGQASRALDTGTDYLWSGTAWVPNKWQTYAPTMTFGTGGSLGNGTLTGAYRTSAIDDTVQFWAQLVLGSSTALGTTSHQISLPVASKGATFPTFLGEAFDSSAGGSISIRTTYSSTTNVSLLVPATTAGAYDRVLTSAAPFTWAVNDRIFISGTYQRA